MKSILFVCSLFLTTNLFAATISLEPGSKITVEADETTTVTCSGSSLSKKPMCKLTTRGNKDSAGKECFSGYCAELIQYGAAVAWNNTNDASSAVQWCNRKTKK